jgi:hypothetical protein
MPWKSGAQQRWGNSPAGHKALGDAGVKEWNEATNYSSLSEKKMGWMQDESEREKKAGTKGKFSAAAVRAGKTTAEYANEKASAPGKLGARARMAKAFMAAKH